MLIYVYDWIKNLTSFVNNTNYTYIDDEDITYIVPPKNGNIILFADQPFEYISNTTDIAMDKEDKLAEFVLLSGIIGILFCTCSVLLYRASKEIKYEKVDLENYEQSDIYPTNTRIEIISSNNSDEPPRYTLDNV
tara:strand:- start:166 stop:570 length:405 start_codon:yes stop_codon:yes gene_type:complete